MKKNKGAVIAMVALVCAAAVFVGAYFATRGATSEGSKTLTIEIVHGNGESREYTIRTDAEYLGEVIVAEGLVNGEEGPYGLYFDTADGETADWNVDQSYWSILIGEEYATIGADGIALTDGGVYSLVYTIG